MTPLHPFEVPYTPDLSLFRLKVENHVSRNEKLEKKRNRNKQFTLVLDTEGVQEH